MMLICRIFYISIWGKPRHKLSPFLLGGQCTSDFLRYITTIHIIKQRLKLCQFFITVMNRIHAIQNCNITHTQRWKNTLNIVTGFNMFTPKPGNIFRNNALNFPFVDILHHPLKFRSIRKIKPRITVININICDFQIL